MEGKKKKKKRWFFASGRSRSVELPRHVRLSEGHEIKRSIWPPGRHGNKTPWALLSKGASTFPGTLTRNVPQPVVASRFACDKKSNIKYCFQWIRTLWAEPACRVGSSFPFFFFTLNWPHANREVSRSVHITYLRAVSQIQGCHVSPESNDRSNDLLVSEAIWTGCFSAGWSPPLFFLFFGINWL